MLPLSVWGTVQKFNNQSGRQKKVTVVAEETPRRDDQHTIIGDASDPTSPSLCHVTRKLAPNGRCQRRPTKRGYAGVELISLRQRSLHWRYDCGRIEGKKLNFETFLSARRFPRSRPANYSTPGYGRRSGRN